MRAAAARQREETERSLKDRAHQLLLRGNVDGAMRVYRQLLDQNRTDANVWLRYAELCQKASRPQEAISAYHTAAKRFEATGYTARARATLACALKLAPKDTGLVRALHLLTPLPSPPLPQAQVQQPEAPAVRGRNERTALLPTVAGRRRPHLTLAPQPPADLDEPIFLDTGFFEIVEEAESDPLQTTQPYIPLFDWLDPAPR